MTKLAPDVISAIISAKRAGAKSKDIAAAHGLTPEGVSRILKRYGVAATRTEEDRQRVVEAFGNGIPVKEIARVEGISEGYAYLILRERGISTQISEDVEARAAAALREGRTGREVAAEFGISPSSVSNIRKRAGLASLGGGTKRALSVEEEDEVLTRYAVHDPAPAIAADLGISVATVYNTLARYERSPHTIAVTLDDYERQQLVETCALGGRTSVEAAALFGVSQETALRILGDAGVRLPKGRPRECLVDDAAFDVIGRAQAYWLGFLFADGYVARDGYGAAKVGMQLAVKDRGHVEKFRTFVGSTHAIADRPPKFKADYGIDSGPTVQFGARSERLATDVIRRGMVEAKADRIPCDEIADSPDFWRGMVDGDGSVGVTECRGHIYPMVSLNGQPRILEVFQEFVETHIGVRLNQIEKPTVPAVSTSGTTALDIIRVLYGRTDGEPVLDRKNYRAQEMLSGRVRRFEPYESWRDVVGE